MKRILALANTRWLRIVGALISLAIPALWLWTLITPPEEVVRIRSVLIFDQGDLTDFEWNPDKVPQTFLLDKGPVSSVFQQAAKDVLMQTPAQNEFATSLTVAEYLMSAPLRTDGPIRANLQTTFYAIKNDGRGYCADFAKVFNGITIAAGVPVRQWGFGFDAFGSGHTFNEIYDSGRKKWILIDSFHSLFFIDPISGEPLSTIEVHDRLLYLGAAQRDIAIKKIVPAKFPFRSDAVALDYYRRGMPQLYLVWGNNVFDYETTLPYKLTSKISRSVEELSSILAGRYPRILVYPIGVSTRDVVELKLHRLRLFLATSAFLLAILIFLLQIVRLIQSRTAAKQQ